MLTEMASYFGLSIDALRGKSRQRDLVTDGETGWVFHADDQSALRTTLARALHDTATRRESLRAAVANRIAHYTYAHATAGLLLAVRAAAPLAPVT
jgi:glycosyltransferase involved in cell wall biosynthesis